MYAQGKHITNDCSMKAKFDEVKCHNCGGNHLANYKGCEIHKQLLRKLFPALRPKQQTEQADKPKQQRQQANISYAQMVKKDTHLVEPQADNSQQITAENKCL
ncbi:hypothetical protein P5V15_011396 [Pogonomyrmex californicus]